MAYPSQIFYCQLIIFVFSLIRKGNGQGCTDVYCQLQYSPGNIALRMIGELLKQNDKIIKEKDVQLKIVNKVLERLEFVLPRHRFVVALYDADSEKLCTGTAHTSVMYEDTDTEKYFVPIGEAGGGGRKGKCLLVANSLKVPGQSVPENVGCVADIAPMFHVGGCTPYPRNITYYINDECEGDYSIWGVFEDGFGPTIASSQPEMVKHLEFACPGKNSGKKWHLIVTPRNDYPTSLELFLSDSIIAGPKKAIVVSHPLFLFTITTIIILIVILITLSLLAFILYRLRVTSTGNKYMMMINAYCAIIPIPNADSAELDCTKIDIERLIHPGPPSRVYFGCFRPSEHEPPLDVCVKMPSDDAFDLHSLEAETRVLVQLRTHARIVKHFGFYRDSFGNIRIVSKFMAGGNLHEFLIANSKSVTIGHIFNFAQQIIEGMQFLVSKKIVHRALSARNCMLNRDCTELRLTDFGLSRKFDDFHKRWQPVECFDGNGQILSNFKFTEKSDVWAFGILLWECFIKGSIPYNDEINFEKVLKRLRSGDANNNVPWRLPCPERCPRAFYIRVMRVCWHPSAVRRPNFNSLQRMLDHVYEALVVENPEIIMRKA